MQKRIAIITNLDEYCGNAQYARDLAHYLQHFRGISGIDLFQHCRDIVPAVEKRQHRYDVAIVNWHPARVEISAPLVHQMKGAGIAVVLILQNSFDWVHDVPDTDLLAVCDLVVAHEPMEIRYNGRPAQNFRYIPHGIVPSTGLVADGVSPEDSVMVGTAGWPFPWKRPDVVVKAAGKCGLVPRIFCPPYPGFTWPLAEWDNLYAASGGKSPMCVAPVGGWLQETEVIEVLMRSKFNIFWFASQGVEDRFGQSGSVRLGVAAGRPMIISRHRKFRTLLDEYPGEFYVADTEEEVYTLAKQLSKDITAGNEVRTPKMCMIRQNWWRAAERYWEGIQERCN